MADLFEAVREACSRPVWSSGVSLARSGAVVLESADDDEVVLRVSLRQGMISHRVILQPAQEDWSCDCPGSDDPCAHVAAAVIARRRAREEGRNLSQPAAGAPGRIGYRFSREGGALALERVVTAGGRSRPLTSTLASIASGRVDGPSFVAAPVDQQVERILGSRLRGEVPAGVMRALLSALEGVGDVQLDGRPLATSATPVAFEGRLVDADPGFLLRVEEVPAVDERFHNRAARCGDTLHPLGETRLRGRELATLPEGRTFPPDAVKELVTEVLPDLQQRIPVAIRTSRLPDTTRGTPRLLLEVERQEEALSVLPTLVYGDPPNARIDAGALVHLRGPIPLRDLEGERRLIRALHNELGLAPGHRARLAGEEAVELAERLAGWEGGEVRGRAHEAFRRAPALAPKVHVTGARFEIGFESPTSPSPRRADPARVLRAWRAGESLVPLEGGGFAPLPAEWLARHGDRVADLLAARALGGELPACALPDLAALCEDLDAPPPPGFERLRALVGGFESLPEPSLPADLRATLRPYQQLGVAWLCFLRDAGLGALLADDMGLGKTVQSLCAVRGRTLVVSPTSVLHNWAEEIERFRPGLGCAVYHGPRRALDPGADVTLTTYAILRMDAETLAGEPWETVVLDEAQNIKNPQSQVARAAYRLPGGFRVALTGTPVENRLEELWSQLHFTNPGLLGSREDFEERYASAVGAGRPGAAERLRARIRPFVLRRRKREVAPELPPRTDVVLHCALSESERAVYQAVRATTVAEVVAQLDAGGSVLAALEALLRLRQAACHPALVPGQRADGSTKIELLLEELETSVAEGHKALVFSQWTSLLDLVEPHLHAAGIPFSRLDGSTRDRAAVVHGFQKEQGPPVLLVSLRAGGTGLNLTAADCVFLLDPWWNPAVEDQAADRTHRIGQDRPVFVYRLVAEGTVEEGILGLQQRKRELADAALGEAERAASLTRDDLLALLEA